MKFHRTAFPPHIKIYLMGWIVYFIGYFGRYNYSASMIAIGQAEGFQKSELGLIASIVFLTYGFGQLLSGWLGDRLNPKVMICIGTIGLTLSNVLMGLSRSLFQMQLIWGMNGLFSAMIWAPMIRLLTACMPKEQLKKAGSFVFLCYFIWSNRYLFTEFLSCLPFFLEDGLSRSRRSLLLINTWLGSDFFHG